MRLRRDNTGGRCGMLRRLRLGHGLALPPDRTANEDNAVRRAGRAGFGRTQPHGAGAEAVLASHRRPGPVCGGAGLFWRAVSVSRGKLAACGQGCVSREILSTGPYRYIRHPFYAAYNLTWLAGFVATGRWPLALSAAGMAALYESCARDEERAFLRAPMGAAYRVYSARAGRYLPRFTRAFGPGI